MHVKLQNFVGSILYVEFSIYVKYSMLDFFFFKIRCMLNLMILEIHGYAFGYNSAMKDISSKIYKQIVYVLIVNWIMIRNFGFGDYLNMYGWLVIVIAI